MTILPPRVLIVLALSIAMMQARTAGASDAASENQERAARANYRQGVELYEAGQFEQAAIAFERAYEIRPSYKILWNLAQAENELGHFAAASVAYSRYLAEGGAEVLADRRTEAQAEIERLSTLVGTVLVDVPLTGATVFVDGKKQGLTPLDGPLLLDLGEHEIILRLDAKELHREVVRVAGGRQTVVSVGKPGDEPGSAGPAANPAAAPKRRVWTWVAFGAGGAAGIAGGILGGVSLSNKSDIEAHCLDRHCPPDYKTEAAKVENMALGADILYGVAAAGVIAGVVLLFVEPKLGSSHEVVALPTVSDQAAGLAVSGRF